MLLGGHVAEEALLAEVKVEALQTAVAEADNRIRPTEVALGRVAGLLRQTQPVQHQQPHQRLRLGADPVEHLLGGDALRRRPAGHLQTAAH